MNTHPTPVSDLIIEQFRAGEDHSVVGLILTLRDLELKLTAALAEIDRLDVSGIHSCHANCQKSMCVMRRELTAVTEQRDELAESLDFQFKLNRECIDQITTRTKERDEALKDLIFWQSLADPRFARFGEAMWKYITKQGGDFCWSEDSEDILPLAQAAGLCCRVEYDPAIHGAVIEADLGDEIWWWGDFDWMNNQPTEP